MAQNDLLVRLGLDANNFNRSINETRRSITDLGERATNELVDIANQFRRTADSPAPLARKLKEIRAQLEQMTREGYTTTAEGKAMYERLASAAREYDAMLRQIQQDTREVGEENKTIEFPDFKSIGSDLLNQSGLGGISNVLGSISKGINPVTIGISAVGGTMIAAGKAAADFETHLDDLQALTKASDETIQSMGQTSMDLAAKFGISAGEIVDSLGLIGSNAPELLAMPEALTSVADAAMTLGKAGSISAEEAASAITTVMNQMKVSADEAMNIANVLEASEQSGTKSVDFLNRAILKSGTAARISGLSYVDLAAMIETIGPSCESGETAGTKLNNILFSLANAKDEFNPAIVGMTQALQNLGDANLSTAELSKLVGTSQAAILKEMIDGISVYENFKQKIDGTNAAVDAWKMKSDNMAGAIARLKAIFENFLIKLGQSGVMDMLLDGVQTVMEALGELMQALGPLLYEILTCFQGGEDGANEFAEVLGFVVDVLKVIIDVATVMKRMMNIAFESIRKKIREVAEWIGNKWNDLKKVLQDIAFTRVIINAFESMVNKIAGFIKKIKEWWNDLKKALGMNVSSDSGSGTKGLTPEQRKAQEEIERQRLKEETLSKNAAAEERANSGKSSKSGAGKSRTGKSEKIDYIVSLDDNSLDTAEKKLSAWTSKKKSLNVDDKEALAKCDEEIKKWSEEVKKRKLIIDNAEISPGSKADLEAQLKELEDKQKLMLNTIVDPADMQKIISEINDVKKKIENEEIRIGLKPEIKEGSLNYIKKQISDKENEIKLSLNADISPEYFKKLQDELKQLRKDEEAKEIELGIKTDNSKIIQAQENLDKFKSQMDGVASITGSLGSTFGSLGSAIGGTSGEIMKFAGTSVSALAQIIPQIISLITAKEAEALAAGTASGASMPFPANIAAIASIVATIAGVFASLPKFATGGIVGGTSYTGDKLLARVNSGEMILNRQQQSNLYSSLAAAEVGNASNTLRGDVNFTISGAALKGTLRNYESKISKMK